MDKLKIINTFTLFKRNEDPQEYLRKLIIWIEKIYADFALRINRNMGCDGSATWNPGAIGNGAEEAKEVTVTDAVLGDFAIASFSLDVTDLVLDAQVTAADTVTCILANNTGGAINLNEGTLRVKVIKK